LGGFEPTRAMKTLSGFLHARHSGAVSFSTTLDGFD
jgi:hypothetical protein